MSRMGIGGIGGLAVVRLCDKEAAISAIRMQRKEETVIFYSILGIRYPSFVPSAIDTPHL